MKNEREIIDLRKSENYEYQYRLRRLETQKFEFNLTPSHCFFSSLLFFCQND